MKSLHKLFEDFEIFQKRKVTFLYKALKKGQIELQTSFIAFKMFALQMFAFWVFALWIFIQC